MYFKELITENNIIHIYYEKVNENDKKEKIKKDDEHAINLSK